MKTATATRNTLDNESLALLGQMRTDKRARVLTALQTGNIETIQRALGRYRKAEYVNGTIQISQKYY